VAGILDAWCDGLRGLRWELLLEPTPSRGRSLRNLTVNTFHPIELLPEAWEQGRFDWDPDRDEERELVLGDAAAIVDYADGIAGGWHDFLLRTGDQSADLTVRTPRGELSFAELLDSQRWHAAYHYRQLVAFLRSRGEALATYALPDVELPDDVF
jgi:hypothetical protein